MLLFPKSALDKARCWAQAHICQFFELTQLTLPEAEYCALIPWTHTHFWQSCAGGR